MEEKIKQLCDQVRETAYAIHKYPGTGHLEKVYENALAHRLLINFGSYKFQIKKFVMDKVKQISRIPKILSVILSFAPFALFRG